LHFELAIPAQAGTRPSADQAADKWAPTFVGVVL
jgi:hypothetical protein